jgi:type I restriction enzyme S subunit
MSSEWRECSLDDVAELTGGYAFKSSQYQINGVFVLRTLNISDGGSISQDDAVFVSDADAREFSRFQLCEKDILFVMVGATLGKIGKVSKSVLPALLNQNMWRIRARRDLADQDFLYYSFKESVLEIIGWASGSARGFLRRDDCRNLKINLPPVEEQKAIAHILGTLDDKIELNRKTNETLEAMAKALFKSWFVDFDPVRAKAEGRPTVLPAEISDLFPDSFEDSELGEIPSGWMTGRLEEILEVDPPRQLRRGSISPYLEMKGVPTSGHSAVDVIGREFTSGSKFRNGDTLLARITPCLENGKTAFVDFLKDGEMGWGSTEFIVMCGRREELNPFAYYLARSEVFRNHSIKNMVGSSGRQRVPSDAVSAFTLPLPPEEILLKFGLLATDLMRKISERAAQSSILSTIRDTLLPKLISGEIRIPDAEKMLEEVGV